MQKPILSICIILTILMILTTTISNSTHILKEKYEQNEIEKNNDIFDIRYVYQRGNSKYQQVMIEQLNNLSQNNQKTNNKKSTDKPFKLKTSEEIQTTNVLMNSSWPMFQHDTHHTGRSPYAPTGNTPVLKWTYKMLGNRRQSSGLVFCSPVIAEDGTIYIADSHLVDGCLYALNPDGTEKWRYEHSDWVHSTPALVEDGTIFMGCDNGKLYAFNPDGTLKWDIVLGSRWITSAPVVDNNGTIYVGSTDEYFYAINPNGTIKWSYKMDHKIYSSPAIDDNGVIYIGSHDNYLYAFYHDGTLKWKFKANDVVKSPPSIDDDGTIYFGTWAYYDNVYALYPNGTVKWRFSVDDAVDTSPAIGYNGDIYVGSYNGVVYSISPDGKKNWGFRAGSGGDDGWVIASVVIDKNGIIYVGSLDGDFFALNPDGSVLWQYDTNLDIEVSAAIGEDGTIYFAAHKPLGPSPRLYAFDVVDNQPPIRPYINGTSSGKIGHMYTYNISSTDPEGQDISYYIDWDDGTNSGWIDPYPSGENITVNHTWNNRGIYDIRVKARDIHGYESDWSTLEVTMPKAYIHNPIIALLMKMVKCFPSFEIILNQILPLWFD